MIDLPTPEERCLEAKRLLEGLNGQWVADRVGVSKATVRLWRRGERIPDLEDLLRLPGATGRSLDPAIAERVSRLVNDYEPVSVKDVGEVSG